MIYIISKKVSWKLLNHLFLRHTSHSELYARDINSKVLSFQPICICDIYLNTVSSIAGSYHGYFFVSRDKSVDPVVLTRLTKSSLITAVKKLLTVFSVVYH